MTLVINLFAGPGTGKSTTAAGVFSLLKQHGVNCEYVSEFAKDLAWESRHKTFHNQPYIWSKQYHKMWRVRDEVDVIITDSPLLLSLVYGQDNPPPFIEMVLHTFKEFDNMNYFLQRVKPFNPKGRLQNEEEARDLDREIEKMLMDYEIGYWGLEGNYSAVNHIVEVVLHKMAKEVKVIMVGVS